MAPVSQCHLHPTDNPDSLLVPVLDAVQGNSVPYRALGWYAWYASLMPWCLIPLSVKREDCCCLSLIYFHLFVCSSAVSVHLFPVIQFVGGLKIHCKESDPVPYINKLVMFFLDFILNNKKCFSKQQHPLNHVLKLLIYACGLSFTASH